MENFEDKLRAWEEDVERLNRINNGKSDVDDGLKPVYLEDLMPAALRDRYNLEKHLLRDYEKLKQRFDRMILEFKNSKALQRPRGLHDLERQFPEGAPEAEAEPEDNLLYSLLLHAKESDVAKVLGAEELMTFQRWKSKGGGKGGKGGGRWPGKGGERPGSNPGAPGGAAPTNAAAPFDGSCSHCGQKGHRKRECPELDRIMAERRAQGLSPPRGQKGNWQSGGEKGKGKGAYNLDFPQIDQWPGAQVPQGANTQLALPASGKSPSPPQVQMATAWPGGQGWGQSGWGGRLAVMERHCPQEELVEVQEPFRSTEEG